MALFTHIIYATRDNYIDKLNVSTNNGTDARIQAQKTVSAHKIPLLTFRIPNDIQSLEIESANLLFTVAVSAIGSFAWTVNRIVPDWGESTSSWEESDFPALSRVSPGDHAGWVGSASACRRECAPPQGENQNPHGKSCWVPRPDGTRRP